MTKKVRAFWKQAEEDRKIVKTWPEWMQRIVISAESAMTGNFIREVKSNAKAR